MLIIPEVVDFKLECGHKVSAAWPIDKPKKEDLLGTWKIKCEECNSFEVVVDYDRGDFDV